MTAALTGRVFGDRVALAATGVWTATAAAELEKLVEETTRRYGHARSVDIDLARLERLDTFGAWLIERLERAFTAGGSSARIVGLSDADRGLIEEVRLVNRTPAKQRVAENRVFVALDQVGRAIAEMGWSLVLLAQLLGALAMAAAGTITHPRRLRLTSTVHHLERVGWRAVPIILLITFLIGAILAQQGLFHFRQFGAGIYVVDMVGILVLREVGVLMVAVMVAGRSGSSYTAELGSMKMREEIDALRTMGFDPIDVLVLPRVLALVIALPCLAFLGSMAALYGGGLMCWAYGGMSPDVFMTRLREAVWLGDFAIGLIKAPFMGLIIGVIAAMEGLAVKGSAESLGRKTTESVVKSIFLVILVDGVLAMFFAAVGM